MALDIGKFILVAGGAFVAYELFLAPSAAPVVTPAAGGIQPAAPATAPAAPALSAIQPGILVIANAQNPPFTEGTADQWGYYYAQFTGKPATDPGSYLSPANRQESFALPAWCGASGLCGIVPMTSGMSGYFPTNRLSVFNEE